MANDIIEGTTDAPAHDTAQMLLLKSEQLQPPPADVPANTGEPASDAAPKKKGGWPLGKPRGPRQPRPSAPQGKDYVPPSPQERAAEAAPGGDAPAVRALPDPALVEFVRPFAKMGFLLLTGIVAKVTKRRDLLASDAEAEQVAAAAAPVVALRMPAAGAASPEMVLVLALCGYAIPRIDPSIMGPPETGATPAPAGDPELQGAPVRVVE